MDEQTGMTKEIVVFRDFTKAPEKSNFPNSSGNKSKIQKKWKRKIWMFYRVVLTPLADPLNTT